MLRRAVVQEWGYTFKTFKTFNRCAPFKPLNITPSDFLRGETESEVTEIAEYDIAIIGAGVAGLATALKRTLQ